MHITLELTLKQYYFGSIYFPLSSASKANIQPTILLPTCQPLTKCFAHMHCTCAHVHYNKEWITLHQGAHNITPI